MKKLLIIIATVLLPVLSQAANIVAAEYFFDTDPGVGNGSPLSSGAVSDSVNFSATISTAGLMPGSSHSLFIRTLDQDGIWSITEGRSFTIVPQIVAAEYFFDTDPGVGNGTPHPAGAVSDSVNFSATVSTSGLALGMSHTLFVRTQDQGGNWSISEGRTFTIVSRIVAAEYFFDTDPGQGLATNIPVGAPSDSVNFSLTNILTTGLSNGYHWLNVRTQNETGAWGLAEARPVIVGTCLSFPEDSLIAWWAFDEAGSNVSKDVTGNHDGIILNDAMQFSYMEFDGNDDYIGLPDHPDFAFGTRDFSIDFFANFAAPGGDASKPGDRFVGQSDGPFAAPKWTFALGGGQLFLNIGDGVTYQNFVQSAFNPVIDQWYHLALTRSGDTLRTYIDGAVSGYQILPGFVMPDVTSPLTIGFVDWYHTIGDPGYVAGKLDEMTIYKRALSQQEISDIKDAGLVGKCKNLRITTPALSDAQFAASYSQTLEVAFGREPLVWSVVGGALPDSVVLDSATGTLSGFLREAGKFTFTAQVTDANNDTAQKVFTLNSLLTVPASSFTIYKSGTSAVAGWNMDYFILIENVGSVGDSFLVAEFLEPWFTYLSSYPAAEVVSYMPNYYTADSTDSLPSFLAWDLLLAPGELSVLTYKVKLQDDISMGTIVNGRSCGSGSGSGGGAPTSIQKKAYKSCYKIWQDIFNAGYRNCDRAFPKIGSPLNDDAWSECADNVDDHADDLRKACMNALAPRPKCPPNPIPVVIPRDPNEKLVLAEKYIPQEKLLVYPIHYENIGTAPAVDIHLTDTLDPNLDETTLEIISSAGSSFDTTSRVLRWDLLNDTLQPDSSGYVLFSIRPKPNLPGGTVIPNKAYIEFDAFGTLATNETVNIIDFSLPEGVMDPLPDTMYQTSFPVYWGGADSLGEIKSYTVFVSEDGGGYSPYYYKTEDTSGIFTGENGKTYDFICIAEDVAGNIEVQDPPLAEATTHLVVLCNNKYFRDEDNDGYGDEYSTTLSCAVPSGYSADSTDCVDRDSTIHPGVAETCNYTDDNCDGQIDEGLILTIYVDRDNDGYGNPDTSFNYCSLSAGFSLDSTDCNDTAAAIHPGALEIANGIDDNCNDSIDEGIVSIYDVNNGLASLYVYPNPFSGKLNIEFSLAKNSKVKLEILGITGKRVEVLFEGDVYAGKKQKFEYNDAIISDGIIIYCLQTEWGIYYGKAVMVK